LSQTANGEALGEIQGSKELAELFGKVIGAILIANRAIESTNQFNRKIYEAESGLFARAKSRLPSLDFGDSLYVQLADGTRYLVKDRMPPETLGKISSDLRIHELISWRAVPAKPDQLI
jgi:hypothetical protein